MVYDIVHHVASIPHGDTCFFSAAPIINSLGEAGQNLSHWMGDHLSMLPGLSKLPVFAASNEANTASASFEETHPTVVHPGPRFVEYFAKDCPHCVHFAPTWKHAAQNWEAKHPDAAVMWEQKECFGLGWKPGKDYNECVSDQVESFPTIKFYSKGDNVGNYLDDDRTEDRLTKFLEEHTGSTTSASHEAKDASGEQVPERSHVVDTGSDANGARMVEYFAKSCPHCQHMEPVWKEAAQKWSAEHPGSVSWEQKECYSDGWANGKDHDECVKEGIHSFPAVRFYGHSSKDLANFEDDRTVSKLLQFTHDHAKPAEEARVEDLQAQAGPENKPSESDQTANGQVEPAVAAAAGDAASLKVVAYVAKSCPHCQHLEPVWKDAQAIWKGKSNVSWEQKECFAEDWKPGKDLDECKKQSVHGFPTIKLYNGSASDGEEFQGDRTASGINNWVRKHSGPEPADVMKAAPMQAAITPQLFSALLCAPGRMVKRKMALASFI